MNGFKLDTSRVSIRLEENGTVYIVDELANEVLAELRCDRMFFGNEASDWDYVGTRTKIITSGYDFINAIQKAGASIKHKGRKK